MKREKRQPKKYHNSMLQKKVNFSNNKTILSRAMLFAKHRVGLPFDISSDYSIR